MYLALALLLYFDILIFLEFIAYHWINQVYGLKRYIANLKYYKLSQNKSLRKSTEFTRSSNAF